MIRDKRSLIQLLRKYDAPAYLMNDLREGASVRVSTLASAEAVHDIYLRRERVQKSPRNRAPQFKGFTALLRSLRQLATDEQVRVTEVSAPNHELILFSDEHGRKLFGLLYAKMEHAEFWHEYADGRSRLAYERGVSDTLKR